MTVFAGGFPSPSHASGVNASARTLIDVNAGKVFDVMLPSSRHPALFDGRSFRAGRASGVGTLAVPRSLPSPSGALSSRNAVGNRCTQSDIELLVLLITPGVATCDAG
ncbi:hypothetical protein EJB05_21850 [Eragrostis curvula]|uniref:Uncharacterized protein n=1 Tax=Eragrostis curvula TaxID=38414 RepID=A0A5J9V4H3_9POAL|nr:hypothetical protein EJB05_21850 [Eragrostis curvula]